VGVGPAGTTLVDLGKNEHFPMTEHLKEAGVFLVGESRNRERRSTWERIPSRWVHSLLSRILWRWACFYALRESSSMSTGVCHF